MRRLENKVALITGAASGLGRSMALLFAQEGARVVAADRKEEGLKTLEHEIGLNGGVVHTVVADMAQPEQVDAMVRTALATFSGLDILVNNAGVMDDFSPVDLMTDEVWHRVMRINVEAPMRAMRSALKHMVPKGAGVILNIASVGGLQGARAGAAYTTSKHALIGLTRNTGYLHARDGIRCNAIAPGAMNTSIGETIDFAHLPAADLFNERIAPGMALNPRSSEPIEVARLALFLVSDDASFVNGSVVVADGGWTAY